MRILFFIDSLISGGKERRIVELMKGLRQAPGVEFEIVLMNDQVHYQEVFAMKIPVHYLIRETKRDISVFKKFYRICKNFRPDIVHCWDSMTAVYAVPVCKLLGIKLINGMVVDTPVTRNFSNKYWMRGKLTFPFSSLVLGNSKAGLNAYGAPAGKSACVYNGMNFSRFNQLRDPGCVRKELL
ncbi:MAG TPA: glycosyltransferase, partial [Chitinophagaceae bacterium]